jgi:hypothetical protein
MRAFWLVLALAVAPVVAGASPSAPSFSYIGNVQVDQPVEQQSDFPFDPTGLYVENPHQFTPCAWDVDDHWERIASGTLQPGQSITAVDCMIADAIVHCRMLHGSYGCFSTPSGRRGAIVTSSTPGLVVTDCYQPQGRCLTANETYDAANRRYMYKLCSWADYETGDPALQSIDDGYGVIQTITTTIANPTSRRPKIFANVAAVGGGSGVSRSGCSTPIGPEQLEYPFHWATG